MSNKTETNEPKRKPQPEVKQDGGKKPRPENSDQQGETANVKQNTQNRQKNR